MCSRRIRPGKYLINITFSISFRSLGYNEARKNNKIFGRKEAWPEAKKEVTPLITLTTFIAFFGFITLFSFNVLTIRELGVLSAMGVLNLWFLSVFLLPGIHSIIGDKAFKKNDARNFLFLNRTYAFLREGCLRAINLIPEERQATAGFAMIIGILVVALASVLDGRLIVGSKPVEFLKGTLLEKTEKYMNQPGNPGFDFVDLFIEPNKPKIIFDEEGNIESPASRDSEFIASVWKFMKELKNTEGVKELAGILNTVNHLTRQTFNKEMPATRQESGYLFLFNIESDLESKIREQLYSEYGYRLSVFSESNNSIAIGELRERILNLSKKFPDLKVSFFGKVAMYPSVDEYITLGKPYNALMSQLVVVLFCSIWIFWGSRRNRSCSNNLISWKTGLVMSVPFLFSSAVILMVMMIFKVPLDISTSAIGALALNASIDFSIYFVHYYKKEILSGNSHQKALNLAMKQEGDIILADMLLNIVCFLPLLISRFLPIQRIGWMMAVMLSSAAFGSLVIMPPMLKWAVKSRKINAN